MSEFSDDFCKIKNVAETLGYDSLWDEETAELKLWAESKWYSVNVVCLSSDSFFAYINVRGAWGQGGDNTASIELLSTYLGVALYKCGYSSSCIWDVDHPVIPGELHAQLISFPQTRELFDHLMVGALLTILRGFEEALPLFLGCSNICCSESQKPATEAELKEWEEFMHSFFDESSNDEISFLVSACPPMEYCTVKEGYLSIFRLHDAELKIEDIPSNGNTALIEGISGDLYIRNNIRHYVPYEDQGYIRKLLIALNACECEVHFFPFENALAAVGGNFLLIRSCECGVKAFNYERDQIRPRHQLEAEYLFSKHNYVWNDKIDDDRFELLCLDLIKLEPDVDWARKVGAGRAADGGKDIEFEKISISKELSQKSIAVQKVKWLAQCKAYKSNVGKGDVRDIRDTIEGNHAVGYLLIVSSNITPQLHDHLSRMKDGNKSFVDWWPRAELEDRLSRNPELLKKYKDIVTRPSG